MSKCWPLPWHIPCSSPVTKSPGFALITHCSPLAQTPPRLFRPPPQLSPFPRAHTIQHPHGSSTSPKLQFTGLSQVNWLHVHKSYTRAKVAGNICALKYKKKMKRRDRGAGSEVKKYIPLCNKVLPKNKVHLSNKIHKMWHSRNTSFFNTVLVYHILYIDGRKRAIRHF